jgi:hypothetical protein
VLPPSSSDSVKSYQGACVAVNRQDKIFIKKLTFDLDGDDILRIKTDKAGTDGRPSIEEYENISDIYAHNNCEASDSSPELTLVKQPDSF